VFRWDGHVLLLFNLQSIIVINVIVKFHRFIARWSSYSWQLSVCNRCFKCRLTDSSAGRQQAAVGRCVKARSQYVLNCSSRTREHQSEQSHWNTSVQNSSSIQFSSCAVNKALNGAGFVDSSSSIRRRYIDPTTTMRLLSCAVLVVDAFLAVSF